MPDSPVLENVYSLIQAGKLAEARQTLSEVAANEQNNPDYWWLLVHASEDPEQGKSALRRVMVLDPGYPGANQLYDQIILDKTTRKTQKQPSRRLLPLVALLLIAISFGALALVLLNRGGQTPGITATSVADTSSGNTTPSVIEATDEATDAAVITETIAGPTDAPSSVIENPPTNTAMTQPSDTPELIPTNTVAATQESPTSFPTQLTAGEPTPTQEALAAQNAAGDLGFLASFRTPDNAVAVVGDAVEISLCAIPGIEAGNAISSLLIAMSGTVGTVDPAVSSVRVAIVDCDGTGFDTRTVQVDRSVLADFAAGSISLQEMQQSIEPVR